ncbi:hypothetical protein [Methanogenium cariaci]|uniref:hypothetical protein n=1 Tax=Methanogenium cariaci TaxID=2197 RepID=UPI0012F68000|nr:hypothetical protein [Methanogenium cariaci]
MQNGLEDTMLDMMFVLAGSIIVAIIGVFYFRHHRKEDIVGSLNGDNALRSLTNTGEK